MEKNKQNEPTEKVFTVSVMRLSHALKDIVIKGAKTAKEAGRMALEKAGNYEFREFTAEYSVDSVREGE